MREREQKQFRAQRFCLGLHAAGTVNYRSSFRFGFQCIVQCRFLQVDIMKYSQAQFCVYGYGYKTVSVLFLTVDWLNVGTVQDFGNNSMRSESLAAQTRHSRGENQQINYRYKQDELYQLVFISISKLKLYKTRRLNLKVNLQFQTDFIILVQLSFTYFDLFKSHTLQIYIISVSIGNQMTRQVCSYAYILFS